jgi:hypothetical protein
MACFSLVSMISNYFQRTKYYSPLRFICEMVALQFGLKVILAVTIFPFLNIRGATTEDLANSDSFSTLFFMAVIVAPVVETIQDQFLSITISSLFVKQSLDILILSMLYFSALHFYVGLAGFFGILPLGFVLSWSFLIKREKSLWQAFWVTTLIHSIHNLIILLL